MMPFDDALHRCEAERKALLDLNRLDNMSWPEIARLERYSEIPMTSLYMWAMGKRPLADEHKIKLGIPVEKPARVCPIHGIVELYDCQTQVVRQKPKPRRRKWRDISTKDLREALENRHAPRW